MKILNCRLLIIFSFPSVSRKGQTCQPADLGSLPVADLPPPGHLNLPICSKSCQGPVGVYSFPNNYYELRIIELEKNNLLKDKTIKELQKSNSGHENAILKLNNILENGQ